MCIFLTLQSYACLSPTVFNGIYSKESLCRIVALVSVAHCKTNPHGHSNMMSVLVDFGYVHRYLSVSEKPGICIPLPLSFSIFFP